MEEREEKPGQVQEKQQNENLDQSENIVAPMEGGEVISKSKQKKLLRAQRNDQWKDVKRKKEKETRRANRLKKKLAGEDIGKVKRELNERPKRISPAKVVIDMSFDELMTDKEIISMGQQLGSLYNSNKWSCSPFSTIIFTGPTEQSLFETSIGQRMELKQHGHWRSWKDIVVRPSGGIEGLDKEQEDQKAVCKKKQLVYLTADSENVLERIEDDKLYIIGGLVDRNRHKCLCADKAKRLGIQTARLPIDPGRLNSSTVLTVNGVVGILLAYNETLDWEATLDRCLPKRKIKKTEAKSEEEGVKSEESTM